MSYAGHVMDMINRFKQNREQIQWRRDKTRELRKAYINAGYIKYKAGKPVHKKLTEEQRQQIRKQIVQEYRKAIWKKVIAFIVALVITAGFFYLIFNKE